MRRRRLTATMTFANHALAKNSWACIFKDQTTLSDNFVQTASALQTVTASGTTASGDVIRYSCVAQ